MPMLLAAFEGPLPSLTDWAAYRRWRGVPLKPPSWLGWRLAMPFAMLLLPSQHQQHYNQLKHGALLVTSPLGARRRRSGGGPGEGCARMPVGTYLYLHAVGVGNLVAVPCFAR
jgi:hypothetical protein